jgi:dinuclear metal center YbgI/SA1388 family protein
MAQLSELVHWCNQTLQANAFKDYCPNGLQIEGKAEVQHVVSSVTASLEAIETALEIGADVLMVHHGFFWKGEASPLVGLKGRRIKQLMQADISLMAYHLPLDAHPQLGNNAALAEVLGISITGALDLSERFPIGNIGEFEQPLSSLAVQQLLAQRLGQMPVMVADPAKMIQRIGFCSGAAQDYLYKAADQGCDAYFSGEISERTYHEAREYGIAYFAAGHHATERYGIQRLASALAQQFGIQHSYVELNNPI